MAQMKQVYRNLMAKGKLDFENKIDKSKPPSKRNTRTTPACMAVTLSL